MENIKEIEHTNQDGSITIYVIEEFAPDEFRSLPKDKWLEEQAAKEAQSLSGGNN